MTYYRTYEHDKYKTLRAFLLCLAIMTDIVAVVSIVMGIFDKIILSVALAAVILGFILRRISLQAVYSYEYALCNGRLKIVKKYIGKNKILLDICGDDIIDIDLYNGEKDVDVMFTGEDERVYKLVLDGGRKVAVMLDNYTYATLCEGGEK